MITSSLYFTSCNFQSVVCSITKQISCFKHSAQKRPPALNYLPCRCFEYYHAYRSGNTFNERLCVVLEQNQDFIFFLYLFFFLLYMYNVSILTKKK